ncbi:DNA methyltransferase [Subtercola sp. YIM 133946]|uniref:DNA methyltransferase n=1 Tax=Subtercola sp. YIM 133946 TaxID=3118909 RepID=UPI002F95F69B
MSPLLTLNTGADPSMDYDTFLRDKVAFDRKFGFDVDDAEISPILKPHQKAIVKWAVRGGRRAIFAKFGLGKSIMQLETLRLVLTRVGGRALIIAPLGVRGEFIRDGRNLLDLDVTFVRRSDQVDGPGIYVTNYESVRDGKLDVSLFEAVSLDEASVLRSFGSETYQRFLQLFEHTPFRFVATATPSPNRHKELIHYAGYLGIMDTGAALTRFFKRDSSNAGNLQLHPHKRDEFWLWLNTWACFLARPSDLGFSDRGYALPDLDVQWHRLEADIASDAVDRDGQGLMFRGGAMSAVEAAREKRRTMELRLDEMMRIVREHHARPGRDQIIIWCHLNDEQSAIEKALLAEGMSYSSVHGSLSDEEAEARLEQWREHGSYALIGKPVMLGQGMNLQQSNTAIFVGVNHKFNETIQAVHRIQRFGQKRPCTVHMIYAETESDVRETLEDKWVEHDRLADTMSSIIRRLGLNPAAVSAELTRAMGVERSVYTGNDWTVALNDSVVEAREHLAEGSVGLIVTSIPFGNHYEYSLNYADFGHTDDNAHFWWQNDYLTPSLYRALKPGRILAVHVKDRMLFGSVTGKGVYTVSPLHAEAIAHYTGHGFDYFGMITVTTDVVRENNQTYRLGYSKMLKDHSSMGVGSPEYVLLFHKPQTDRSVGWADERIVKRLEEYSLGRWQIDAAAEWRTGGNRLLTGDELAQLSPEARSRLFTQQSTVNVYDYDEHVALAEKLLASHSLPSTFASLVPGSWRPDIWHDINRLDTLNSEQRRRDVENHICPFPLDIPRRLIEEWSNPGELIYDPFGGIGSTALCAVEAGRRAYSSELNPASVADSLVYLRRHDNRQSIPSLFDLDDVA